MIDKLLLGNNLQKKEAEQLFNLILDEKSVWPLKTAEQALVLLHKKIETADELLALVNTAQPLSKSKLRSIPSIEIVDGCGTGGDQKQTFNISTVASIVAAASGASVAKHGNRSITSKCGSSDLMEALGVNLNAKKKQMLKALQKARIGYFHAPLYTKAFRPVQALRRELGAQRIRTIFNIAGPLLNPLQPKRQVIGVCHQRYINPLIQVLKKRGTLHALVLSGNDGADELTTYQSTKVAELRGGKILHYTVSPNSYGFKVSGPAELNGGSVQKNTQIALSLLRGKNKPVGGRDTVLLNAAALLYVSGKAKRISDGIVMAKESINSKRALKTLGQLKKISHDS